LTSKHSIICFNAVVCCCSYTMQSSIIASMSSIGCVYKAVPTQWPSLQVSQFWLSADMWPYDLTKIINSNFMFVYLGGRGFVTEKMPNLNKYGTKNCIHICCWKPLREWTSEKTYVYKKKAEKIKVTLQVY
jgi:hypothetical protein